jgi:hypothetical protein
LALGGSSIPERRSINVRVRGRIGWQGISLILIIAASPAAQALTSQEQHTFIPAEGFVPDATTATRIGEAVLVPIYGELAVRQQLPLRSVLQDGIWIVEGTPRQNQVGGVARIEIAKQDARVLRVTHGR